MKSFKFICCPLFAVILYSSLHAQSKDTISAQKIIDKSQGDIILGEKNKKQQLKNTPVLLRPTESFGRKDIIRSSKKSRKTQNKKGS